MSPEKTMRVRQYLRVPVQSRSKILVLEDPPRKEYLPLANISLGGVFLESSKPYPLETLLELTISLPGVPTPIQATGFVCWANQKSGRPGMGVQFITISEKHQKLLLQFIQKSSN